MTQELRQGFVSPNDIDIRSIVYVSASGQTVDISPLTIEISIYQDIFEHYMQCDIVLSDALAFLSSLEGVESSGTPGGFNGGDILVVSFKSNSSDIDYKTHLFGLYALTDRQRVNEKTETYNMSGISIEAYQTITKRISRAYGNGSGNLISNMIKSIVDEFMYNSQVKSLYREFQGVTGSAVQKEVYASPTNGQQRYIIPNMTVDDAIDMLAMEADCDNHVPYYTFYEDTNGFKFIDFNQLITSEPVETYKYITANLQDDRSASSNDTKDYQKIITYNIVKQTDIMFNANRGLFKSRTINLDILRKKKTEYVFDYTKEGDKFSKLQKTKIPGSSDGESLVYLMQSRQGHDEDSIFEKEKPLPKRFNVVASRRSAFKRQILNTVLELTVNGNSELNVGECIDVVIPKATTLEDGDKQEDKYLSGKYIITKIRHKFGGNSGSEFMTFIECTKDTGKDI